MNILAPRSSSLEPPRLAEGAGTEYERQLLASVRWDMVPPGSEEKVHAALRAHALGGAPRHEANAQAPTNAAQLSTVVVIGAGIFGAFLVSQWPQPSEPLIASTAPGGVAPISVAQSGAPTIAVPTAAQSPTPVPSLAVEARAANASEASVATPTARRNRRTPVETKKAAGPRSPASGAQGGGGLAAEIRRIETIRALLGWGQVDDAARALAGYRREFPLGELALEANVLDIDVALARGERAAARRLARALFARPEASRYRPRLRALLEPADGTNPPAP